MHTLIAKSLLTAFHRRREVDAEEWEPRIWYLSESRYRPSKTCEAYRIHIGCDEVMLMRLQTEIFATKWHYLRGRSTARESGNTIRIETRTGDEVARLDRCLKTVVYLAGMCPRTAPASNSSRMQCLGSCDCLMPFSLCPVSTCPPMSWKSLPKWRATTE